MSSRSLCTLALTPAQRGKLNAAGFSTVEELIDMQPVELSKELDCSPQEALAILKVAQQKDGSAEEQDAESMLSVLRAERDRRSISTLCKALDDLIGDGIPPARLTEVCGSPGVGKTQLGMQLCVNVQLPVEFGGLNGQAVYIDTEGSFIPDRVEDIAEATRRHLASHTQDLTAWPLERFLKGIHYFRVHDYVEQIALLVQLGEYMDAHPTIRLIVLDSIAFHFRHDFGDMSLRTRLLSGMAQTLMDVASKHEAAVVLVNQMTTKVSSATSDSHLAPALGETWAHACTNRIILSWQGQKRCATLFKSPVKEEASVLFDITVDGVRDLAGTKRKHGYDD